MIQMHADFADIIESASQPDLNILWTKVGAYLYAAVKRGMVQGRNTDYKVMEDYTAKYKAYKTREGNYRGRVDLIFDSTLWKSIAFHGDEKGFSIFINGEKENKIAIRWNSHKNWTFFQWGTKLNKQLLTVLKKEFNYGKEGV